MGVLIAGTLWRLVLSFALIPAWETRTNIASTPDAYPALARSLLHDGILGYAPHGASPTTVRGPAFPCWLAAGMLLGGDRSDWLGFWGGLPGLLAGGLLAWLTARRFGLAAGSVAGAIAVLHPLPSFIASRVLGDDFYAALGLAGLAAWALALRSSEFRRGMAWTGLAGLLLAGQMLTRSSGLLTLLVAVIVGLRSDKRRAVSSLVLVVLALVPPLLWSVRSSRLEGRPVFVHSLTGYNFWIGEGFDVFGSGAPPVGNWNRILRFTLERADIVDARADGFRYISLGPRQAAELDSKLTRAAVERVTGEPLSYLARLAKGLPRFWFQAQTTRRTVHYVMAVAPILLLALVGVRAILAAGKTRDPLGSMLILTVVLHNAAYAAILPMARMSVQVYPGVAFLAGAGAAWLLARTQLRKARS